MKVKAGNWKVSSFKLQYVIFMSYIEIVRHISNFEGHDFDDTVFLYNPLMIDAC